MSITNARTSLILDYPFFGVLALKLRMIETKSIPTAATDGKAIFYNPDFIAKQDKNQLQGLLVHEIMHCVLQHQLRRQERDQEKWNKACDYVINSNLIKQGFILPGNGCIDDKYIDMTAEHVYSILPDKPTGIGGISNDGDDDKNSTEKGWSKGGEDGENWNWGGVIDGLPEGATVSEIEAEATDWKISVQQAVDQAKMQGKLSAELERLVEEILDPIIDWRTMLLKYIHVPVKEDYNWNRYNKRFLHSGVLLPTLYSHTMGDVAVIVDTSGSISQQELAQFAGELSGICEDAKPRKVHVLYCDTRVHKYDTFELSEYPIKLEAVGGGGTDMAPAFKKIANMDEQPECIICLTDLYLDTDHIPIPACETLWISTGTLDTEVAFGEITRLDL